MIYIFYNFLIIYFIYFILFWSNLLKFSKIFRGTRKIVHYLSLDHGWSVFATPWTHNKNLLLEIEYDDDKKELIILIDGKSKTFFNKKLNTFNEKYAENLYLNLKARTMFIGYLKNKVENEKNKKIKKIKFIEEIIPIELWNLNLNEKFSEKNVITSYSF